MNTPEVMFNVYLDIITGYPQVWIIEVIALLYLLWFAVRWRLYRWAELKQFVLTGRLGRAESGEFRADGAYPSLPQKPVKSPSKLS